jgi:translation initiation factor 2B subunit (eIF-2B alpha/beta/delta family)
MNKKKRFQKIVEDIKKIKIQGATNLAKAALKAYKLLPNKTSKKILLNSRPTEPMMEKVLGKAEKESFEKIMKHFQEAQEKINRNVIKLIKSKDIIFTHCHSTNVSKALIYAHEKRKKFQVFNTETRPLYQGRKTARELRRAGIKVTMFVDSAVATAIERDNRKDKLYATKIFLGADALLSKGVINKIGSKTIVELAKIHKIPVYIIADSWKFTKKKVPMEERALNEVWDKAPKKIKIKNPAFEFVPKKYIKGIITEYGLMRYDNFVKRMKK